MLFQKKPKLPYFLQFDPDVAILFSINTTRAIGNYVEHSWSFSLLSSIVTTQTTIEFVNSLTTPSHVRTVMPPRGG